MKHLGDITKIDGSAIAPVDIITGGSPCQDLSIAGKRAGLDGERSGLFMEQIRIIREMREHDRSNGRAGQFIRPRYMVWENVPGALSSNNGEDFRIVLEETARVADSSAVIPRPEGKWTPSGCIMGPGWSIAWRVHDAQFWGVPQRRRRIALVADFNGQSAPEILFERKGMSGDSEPGEQKEQGAAEGTEGSVGTTGDGDIAGTLDANYFKGPGERNGVERTIVLEGNGTRDSHNGPGFQESDVMYTLNTVEQHCVQVIENHPNDSRVKICDDNIFQTLSSRMGTGGGNVPMVME